MKHLWKRLIASMLTAVMLVSVLPPTALAALADNTPDQNEAILRELTEFWGDEKTAQEAMELLRKYNLMDENGNILTDWSGTITIEEEARGLTFSDAMALTSGTVTVNGRACDTAELSAVLRQMEAMGLLADGQIVADWQIEVTDETETADELETPPAVKVLGRGVDAAALQEVQTFLDQYGLLTENGCLADWGLTQPGGSRPSDLTELLAMVEDESTDRSMVITVDGTPITLGDFETMMEIEAEIKRIRDTYLQDSVDLTPEQASNLYSLYEQLSENGIMLYNTQGADDLVFPSGADHSQRVSVTPTVTVQNGGTGTITLSLAHPAQNTVTVSWRIADGSATGTIGGKTSGTVIFVAGEQSKTLTVQATSSSERWNGNRAFVVEFYDVDGALFSNEAQADSTTVLVSKNYAYPASSSGDKITFNLVDPDKMRSLTEQQQVDFFTYHDGLKPTAGIISTGDYVVFLRSSSYGQFGFYFHYPVNRLKGNFKPGQTPSGSTEDVGFQFKYPENLLPLVQDKVLTEIGFSGTTEMMGEGTGVRYTLLLNGTSVVSHLFAGFWSQAGTSGAPTDPQKDYFTEIFRWEIESTNSRNGVVWLHLGSPYLKDSQNPGVTTITAPDGPYYCGQTIPITVEFSEPVYGNGLQLTVNDTSLPAVDTGASSFGYRQTFLYTVPASGNTQLRVSGIDGMRDLSGKTATHTPAGGNTQVLPEGSMKIPAVLSAVDTTPTVNAGQVTYTPAQGDQEEKTAATVTVALDMPSDENLRNLIGGSYALDDGTFASNVLAASIDGGTTLIPLVLDNSSAPTKMTATVEVDAAELIGISGNAKDFVMEFYTIDGTTHESTGLFFGRYASFSVNKPVPLMAEHLSITKPSGWPTQPIYANNPPEAEALTLQAVVSAPAGTTWTQTRWVSSNENIATIDADGRVYPLSTGTVTFYLEAVNGNLTEYGQQRSEGVSLTIQQGAEPYLRIPEENMSVRAGDPLTVRWASNLVQKNIEYGGENTSTTFTIKVIGPNGQQVGESYTVTYDPANHSATFPGTDIPMWVQDTDESGAEIWSPNQSFTIRGLTDTNTNGYTVTVSASANASVPSTQKDFEATAKVTVVSQPVTVRLTRPGNLFQINQGTLTVNYTLENYDSLNNAQFELVVTNNATGQKVTTITDPDSNTGGSFQIDLTNATITDNFRTIYDVSLKAKNTAEPDWSRDSFTLYIYDKSCLDILVQPVTKNNVTTVGVSGDTVTMSNEDWIASLSQEQILALNRDINLQAAISINYGAHAWGEASDRIHWASSNSNIAAVNYPQGAYYENIEHLPYPSYAPATQFLLSGKNDGTTVVDAVHALAGDALSSNVNITVETLKNKLYLFQFYPVGQVTLTYTNGNGESKTQTSDAQGRAAVYEASGIASDVYVKGTINGDIYLGTVYNSRLVSQEKDAVSLELYPLNSLTLRKAATLPVYLLTDEGKPYNGTVTVRAGVYRNGMLCQEAKYNTTAGSSATIDGNLDNSVTFTNEWQGHLLL